MARPMLTSAQVLTLLAERPPRIAAVTAGLTAVELRTASGAGAWAAIDVLGHLRARANVWGSRIEAMLTSERPTVRAVNPAHDG